MTVEGRAASTHADWSEAVVEPVDRAVAAFSGGLRARLDQMMAAGTDLDLVRSTLAAADWSPMPLLAGIAAVLVAGLAAYRLTARTHGDAVGERAGGFSHAASSPPPPRWPPASSPPPSSPGRRRPSVAPCAPGPSSSRSPGSPRR